MPPRKQYVDGLKHCSGCDTWKQPQEFPTDNRRWDKKHPHCRTCIHDSYEREAHARKCRQYIKNVWERYGLTVEEYQALIAAGCVICGRTEGRIVVDHDHANGKVRAALCAQCNSGLGMFKDDPQRIRAAAAYIEDWQASHA